jgi:hypothetical protein
MNEETAGTNYFQSNTDEDQHEIQRKALSEFDAFVSRLKENGVQVIVVEDRKEVITPDSVFPNNWISFHENGDVALYPMFAENRRLERREDALELLHQKGFEIGRVIDLSDAEEDGKFLEGTGSIILDRENALAYCSISPRSDEELFTEFCELFGYRPVIFRAYQTVNAERLPIYHTNVMLTIGESFAVLCADCIDDEVERERVLKMLKRSEKEIIYITEEQVGAFAGNMLQVTGADENRILVMSATAYNCLTEEQIAQLKEHTEILTVEIPTIERLGGGSARCMMAEVFLPEN